MIYNGDKQRLDKKIKDVENKIPDVSRLVIKIGFNTKIGEVENKILNVSTLVTNTDFDTKIGWVEKKFLIRVNILPLLKLVNFPVKYSMPN